MIKPVTGVENFDKAISKGNVIVGFSAPWCGYCRRLRPIMEKVSEEVQVPIYGVNCDEDKELASRYEVDTIPNLIFFRDGKLVDSIIGFGNVGYPELMEFIKKNDVK